MCKKKYNTKVPCSKERKKKQIVCYSMFKKWKIDKSQALQICFLIQCVPLNLAV